MRNLKFITAFLLGTMLAASARIGESVEECAKRYGEVVESDPDGGQTFYSKGAVKIQCRFTDGKCDVVIYDFSSASLVIMEKYELRKKFTQNQSTRLLNLNGGGSQWRQVSKESFGEAWHGIYETEDGKIHADITGSRVCIESMERYKLRLERLQDTEVEKALTGIGADAAKSAPKPLTGKFPPTPEEQENIDLQNSLDELQKSLADPKK